MCVPARVHVCAFTCMCVFTHVFVHVHVCVCTCACVCAHVRVSQACVHFLLLPSLSVLSRYSVHTVTCTDLKGRAGRVLTNM